MSAIPRRSRDPLSEQFERMRRPTSRATFFTRAVRGLADLAERASPSWLHHAAAAPTDYEVLLRALQIPGVAEADDSIRLVIRGFQERDKLLRMRGGVLRAEAVARHLRVSRQAIDKRRRAGTLIGLALGRRGYGYPAWQFGKDGTVPGLDRVLKALRSHDRWTQCAFLVNPNSELAGTAPIDALADGRIEEVERLASAFGEHGSL